MGKTIRFDKNNIPKDSRNPEFLKSNKFKKISKNGNYRGQKPNN